MTVQSRTVLIKALRLGGDLDPVLEMQRQPHSINGLYAAITCERPRVCLLGTHDLEIACHSTSTETQSAVHNLVGAGHVCVSGLEVVGGRFSSSVCRLPPFTHRKPGCPLYPSVCLRGLGSDLAPLLVEQQMATLFSASVSH